MYLSYFRFQSNAWQDEGVIFFLSQVSQWRRCEFFLFIFCKKKQVLLKSKSLSLKTIRVLQRILTIFVKSKELSTGPQLFSNEELTFWNRQVYLRREFLFYKSTEFLQRCWWHIEEIISSFWENIYLELFSFSIKRAARWGCDFLLTSLGGGL